MALDYTPLMRAIEAYIRKADSDLEEQLDAEGYVAAGAAVAAIEALDDELHEALDTNTDALLERLQEATGADDFVTNIWPEIADADDLENALKKIFRKKFDDMLHSFTKAWMLREDEAIAVDDRITKPAEDFVYSWSGELASKMKLTTNEQIENILLDCVKEKLSVADVGLKIGESGIRECGYRTRSTAVTEVLRMESYSQLEYMRQDPAVEEKEWYHTGTHKNKPRPNHQAISGQVKPVDEPFDLTGADGATYHPMCPRDTCLPAGESINCHCIMKSHKSRKVLGMTGEERSALRQKYMDEVDAEWEAKKAATEGKIDWPDKGTKISTEEYKEVMKYAKSKKVRLSGFKQFDGDIQTVKDMVDDVEEIAADYPEILEGKKKLTIWLNDSLSSEDFAVTRDHIININANAFRDTARLQEEYQKLVDQGWFVAGTDYRSIIKHEVGHVVTAKYGYDGLSIAKDVTGITSSTDLMDYLRQNLSQYSSEYLDGREIISECFAGTYGIAENKNKFALQILEQLGIIQ